jgi:hypothetical protein
MFLSFLKRRQSALSLSNPRPAVGLSPIVVRSNQNHWLSWFLMGSLAGSSLAVAVWFKAVNWSFPTLPPSEAFSAVFEAHPGRTNKLKANEGDRTPRLAFQTSIGAINDPLPLGIVVNNSAGGETLVLSDLAEGTKLSVGTALGPARWSVPGRDLDKTFIAAPENFSGSMHAVAKLYSSDNLLLETKDIRFEWTGSQTENIDRTIARPAVPDLAADGRDATRFSNGSVLMSGQGTDAPTTGYSESSARWCNQIGQSATDCISQISPDLLPSAHAPSDKKALAQRLASLPSTTASLLERGERLLREGNVAAARPLLRRAADAGNADAALDLGISFDPSFVAYANPRAADPVQAARWYKRAFKLGRKDVAADLERITNMTKDSATPKSR